MKSRYRKPARQSRLPLLYAILATIFPAAFFFYGFRVSPRHLPSPSEPEREPASIMIEADDLDCEYTRNLVAWSLIGDPTIMSLPNPELGLSALHRHRLSVSFKDLPPLSVNLPDPEITLEDTTAFELPEWSIAKEDISHAWGIIVPKPERLRQQSLPRQLIWRLRGEGPIINSPRIETEEVREKAVETSPERPTIVEIITPADGNTRYLIRESSGNRELDQLALQSLQRTLFGLRPGESINQDDSKSEEVRLKLPSPGESLQVEIEWRLVLP